MTTKKICIKELQKLLAKEGHVTRDLVRTKSKIEEQEWRQHFGTFTQFKREAGINVSRHVRTMESDIARHASVDSYKKMNDEKRNWDGRYKRPSDKKYQSILIGSDIHDIECDPFWRELFIDTALRVQPEKIIINGDLWDAPEFGKYTVDPREWNVVGRIKWCHEFFHDLRRVAPNAELILIEGNHEFRLLRHLSEATPAMKAILSDLHGFTVPKLLGLDKYEVNYVAPADLATFNNGDVHKELSRNFLVMYDFLVAHHFPEGKAFGLPGFNGHHHKHLVDMGYNPVLGSFEWHQLGGGHIRHASYCNGEKWSNGFLLAHCDTKEKRVQFEYIDCSSDYAVVGGKWYERSK